LIYLLSDRQGSSWKTSMSIQNSCWC